MLTLLCTLVVALPVGTKLGLLHLLWMLVSGRLLEARGAVIPGLDACGLARGAVRRGGAAAGAGGRGWRGFRGGRVAGGGGGGGQRLGLPLALVPAPEDDARPTAHARALVRAGVAHCARDDVLVCDAGFPLALLQEEGAERFVVRLAKNATFRRATPPADARGTGAPARAAVQGAHAGRYAARCGAE